MKESRFGSRKKQEVSSSPKSPDRVWGPRILLIDGFRRHRKRRGVKSPYLRFRMNLRAMVAVV